MKESNETYNSLNINTYLSILFRADSKDQYSHEKYVTADRFSFRYKNQTSKIELNAAIITHKPDAAIKVQLHRYR